MSSKKKNDCQHCLDISLAIPIANGVSFVSTSIVGTLIGEETPKISKFIGKQNENYKQIYGLHT